jgi:hypothetical protein
MNYVKMWSRHVGDNCFEKMNYLMFFLLAWIYPNEQLIWLSVITALKMTKISCSFITLKPVENIGLLCFFLQHVIFFCKISPKC